MKIPKPLISIFIIMFTLCPLLAFGQTWVECSTGLIPPEMEGGNTELEFADIDFDGNVDLLSIGDHGSPYINTDQHGIMVWFGDGNGNWSVHQNGNFGYGGIAVGDVNNDGFLDVGYGMHHDYSSSDFGDQLIEVALGDGTGMSWIPYDNGLATSGEDYGMFGTDFADIDADGLLDIVSVSFGYGSGIHVYRNQGDGTWAHAYGYNGGNCNLYVEFGDINGDGYPDIISCNANSGIFINDGEGSFGMLHGGGITPPGNLGYQDIALGDVDNDGRDEVAIVPGNDVIEVWKLNEDGETWTEISDGLGSYTGMQMVDIAEMNGDNFLDIVGYGYMDVVIFTGNGGAFWEEFYSFSMPEPGYAKALRAGADIDHNGFGDIAVVNAERIDWLNTQNHCRAFKESSIPDQLTVVGVYPHGREVLRGGSAGWVEWVSAVPPGEETNVEIEFSHTGPGGPFQAVADEIPNNGRHQLNWPDGINSADCYLKITVHGDTDVSVLTPEAFEIRSTETEADEESPDRPQETTLLNSYPNPFNVSTSIRYVLSVETDLSLNVYDLMGRHIDTIFEGVQEPGEHTAIWDAADLPSGVYFVKLTTREKSESIKTILLK